MEHSFIHRNHLRLSAIGNALAAGGITLLLWLIILAIFGFYPFGERSMLITDMGSQYVEFYAALLNKLHGAGSLLYTWDTGMGMNFLGLIGYYMSSPFTLLLLPFPSELLTEGILLMISAKIAAAALTFSCYLRYRFAIRGVVNIAFAVVYALSGYTVVYCFNLMWLDGVILLPMLVLAAKHLFDQKRILPFTLALAVLFIANFYISFMAGLFLFLVFVGWLVSEQLSIRVRLQYLGRFFVGTLLAAGLSAFLLLPMFFALRTGYIAVNGFEVTFTALLNPLVLPGKLAWGAFDSATNSGTPYIYCGILTLLMLPLWFLHSNISRREKYYTGGLLLFFLASMTLYDLDVAWHVFQPPTWFPCRYSFTLIFLLIVCAARAFSRPEGIPIKAVLISMVSLSVSLLLCSISGYTPFAGNVEVTIALLIIYTVLSFSIWLQPRVADFTSKAARCCCRLLKPGTLLLLLTVVSVEMVSNAVVVLRGLDAQLGFPKREEYAAFSKRGTALKTATQEIAGTSFYRMENSTARNANDGLSIGYHSLSHYSSLSNQRTFRFMGNLGMICYVNNRYFRYYGATSALDAVMGVKYVWDTEERRYGYVPTGAQWGDTRVYENTHALALMYFADAAVLDTPIQDKNPFELQNRFLSGLCGSEQMFYRPLSVRADAAGGNIIEHRGGCYIQDARDLILTIENPADQHVLLYLQNNFHENAPVYLNGTCLNVYDDRLVRGVIDLGKQPAGTIIVRIPTWTENAWFASLCAYSLDEKRYDDLIGQLREGVPDDLEISNTGVSATVTALSDGIIFTSIPCDDGWTVKVDGKVVETKNVAEAFIAIPVTAGTHEVRMHYRPKGLTMGMIISCVSALGILAFIVIRMIRHKQKSEEENR